MTLSNKYGINYLASIITHYISWSFQVYCDSMPFVFSNATSANCEIRLAPCAQITDLRSMIVGHLEENNR